MYFVVTCDQVGQVSYLSPKFPQLLQMTPFLTVFGCAAHRFTVFHSKSTFSLWQSLRCHMAFVCNACAYSTPYAVAMRAHRRVHSPKEPVPCTQCSRRFPTTALLLLHVKSTHSPENPTFTCALCLGSFESQQELVNHSREVHRPFHCRSCEMRFSSEQEYEEVLSLSLSLHLLPSLSGLPPHLILSPLSCFSLSAS